MVCALSLLIDIVRRLLSTGRVNDETLYPTKTLGLSVASQQSVVSYMNTPI